MIQDIFFQIGIVFILATLGGYLAQITKQPLIPMYIVAGIFLGPIFQLITNSDIIQTLSLSGIAFLLFIVGLEFQFKKLEDIGKIATIGGLLQVALMLSISFFVAVLLGYGNREAIYFGLIVAFSSTMVMVKLLSDKKETSTLHGRVIIGILLMQDVLAIVVLSFLSTVDGFSATRFLDAFFRAGIILAIAAMCSKFIFPRLFKTAAKSQELLFLLAISICMLFSLLFNYIGFSIAIGAFVAGVSIANLPYNLEIIGKIKSLRDFFATLFFVSLGLTLQPGNILHIVYLLAIAIVLVVVLKPLLIMAIGAFFGYAKKTTFLSAFSLGQISEFSLIIAAQGLVYGHISQEMYTLAVVAAIITIASTSYFIKFDKQLFRSVARYFNIFDIVTRGRHLEFHTHPNPTYDVILIGYDRIGYNVFDALEKMKKSFVVIDFNPDIIKKLVQKKIPCIYGDIGDTEILDRLDFRHAEMVISTVNDVLDNQLIIKHCREVNKQAVVFVTANAVEDAMKLYKAGADYVILPHFLGGEYVSVLLQSTKTVKDLMKKKYDHIQELRKRISLGHEHPVHQGY